MKRNACLLWLLLCSASVSAAVVGQNPPALPLTVERVVALLPPDARPAWLAYLARSEAQGRADRAALAAERVDGLAIPAPPEGGAGVKTMPLNRPAVWYAGGEARQVADNIVSFQTPAGGWGKNQPRDRPPRRPGQDYVSNNQSRFASAGDYDQPHDPRWSYVGTIDNDATLTEIRFLAKVVAQLPGEAAQAYRQSLLRGVDYLLAAQLPSGGWPQVWPLQGGYHDAMTLNDDAMVEVAELLRDVSRGEAEFAVVPPALRAQAAAAERRAVQALLAAQVVQAGGRRLLWGQQHDALTLAPTSARNYEPPALCAAESSGVLVYLMAQDEPSPELQRAVHEGVALLRELALKDMVWTRIDAAQGRRLRPQPGAGPLWARYYDRETLKPLFGERDKSLHDDIDDISLERRDGYAWFGTWPLKALAAYEGWARRWPRPRPSP